MTLTRKIVFLIAIIVGLFITLNLAVLPFITRNYFFDFLQQFYIESRENQLDADILNLIKKFPDQAPELLEQYRDIDADLNKLVSGFEEYVNTDPIFNRDSVGKALQDSGVAEKQIDEVIGLNAMSIFLKTVPFGFSFTGENDPKKEFINQVLAAMLAINIAFVAILSVFILYFLRQSFQPIRTITNTLDSFSASSGNFLEYNRKDEFRPLIDSLNNLRRRLDHQEQIRAQFLTDMSHELKTPMTAIGVYLE
jgi:signal transduction histidine kinase